MKRIATFFVDTFSSKSFLFCFLRFGRASCPATYVRFSHLSLLMVLWFVFLRLLVMLVASLGVVLSVLASKSCRFLYLGPEVFSIIGFGIQNQTEGWIGIFRHEITNEETLIQECSVYQSIFDMEGPNEALPASQISAAMAPVVASIGILVSTVELVCCRFFGSFIVVSVLLLAASLFQCGTFAMFVTEQGSCFDEDLCMIGNATYLSAAAVFCFCVSCIILCCSPRPRPCMQNINDDLQLKIDNVDEIPERVGEHETI